jgi:hypothetical protein
MWTTLWLLSGCVTEAPKASAPVSGPVVKAKSKAKASSKAKAPQGALAEVVKPAVRDPARWATARCNDGTPSGLLVRKQEATDTWVIKVAGGFFCEDEKVACGGREPRLTTTLKGDDGSRVDIGRQGLFSLDPAENPTFHGAHHVSFGYCTSDLWLGTSTERQPTQASAEGWYFSGRPAFRAAMESLLTLGLDDANAATKVLVVGHSAGGAGVVGNLDVLAELLPGTVARGGLKLVLDGSWIPTQPVERLPTADKWGPVHAQCDKDVADGRTCVYGPTWWPYVAKTGVPVLVAISGLDVTQTRVFLPERTAESAEAWRKNTLASLEGLPWVFSEGRAYHVLSFEAGFRNGPPEGPKFSELVTKFWEGGEPQRVVFGYDKPLAVPPADGAAATAPTPP